MTFNDQTAALNFIRTSDNINLEDSFNLSKYCSKLLRHKESEKIGRELIIRIQDVWEKIDQRTIPLWNDLTEAAGLYPYADSDLLSSSSQIRYEYHKSRYLADIYLHAEQQAISIELQGKRSVVVSAPTSFGKSLLIEEIIASELYNDIVIIQPTLALLDETRKKLLKYRDKYKIVVSTSQEPAESFRNIFLFTGERVVEYSHFKQVDFFIIDEFYKLSLERDDDRAIALNQALHKLLKFTNRFYMLGPNIKSIPVNFSQKFELLWFPTEFSTVAVDESSMEIRERVKVAEKKRLKNERLFQLLSANDDQTLIYCSSPNRATLLGLQYIAFLQNNQLDSNIENLSENEIMIQWIVQNINPSWSLTNALKLGVAFHHGALPRHLGSSIVDAFNKGSVRWLFCTSTLIEGVNTSAKTVVLFDKEKGKNLIDFFDYKNIAGRSGRMNRHFTGKVIRFEPQPQQMDLFVDIPLFDQENAPLEILIGLDENELEEKAKPRLSEFANYPIELKELLLQNTGISIAGQLKVIETIEGNIDYYHRLLNWSSFPPAFDNLSTVIELCWDNLAGDSDKAYVDQIGRLSARWLAAFTFSYINFKSVSAVINNYINDDFWIEKIPDLQQRIDVASFTILHITRHWFDYKLPKWLSIISNIQKYIFSKHNLKSGDYSFLAANIEHGFLPPTLAALMEYGLPISAINKIRKLINLNDQPEQMLASIKSYSDQQLSQFGLIQYEVNKIRNSI